MAEGKESIYYSTIQCCPKLNVSACIPAFSQGIGERWQQILHDVNDEVVSFVERRLATSLTGEILENVFKKTAVIFNCNAFLIDSCLFLTSFSFL